MAQQVKIKDLDVNYNISYRDIKYPRLEFKTGGLLLVLPKDYQDHEELISKHEKWIYRHSKPIGLALKNSKKKNLKNRTKEEFRNLVHSFVEKTSIELNLKVNKVYFREMKSKWGSLSYRKNLTINTLLSHLPKTLIKYVIHHEMAHLVEKKHNERFWRMVSRGFPDYHKKEKDLLIYWFLVQNQITPRGKNNLKNNHPRIVNLVATEDIYLSRIIL